MIAEHNNYTEEEEFTESNLLKKTVNREGSQGEKNIGWILKECS